jgi:hypothetical protein
MLSFQNIFKNTPTRIDATPSLVVDKPSIRGAFSIMKNYTHCKIEGCKARGTFPKSGREQFTLGYCCMHYTRFKRNGDPNIKGVIRIYVKKTPNPLYELYRSMITRCTNSKCNGYKNYGGRGITVCDNWLGENGFSNFCKDMGERPKGTTLDRIDNNKGYSKENCRWATWHQQNANTSRNNEVVGVYWNKNGYYSAKLKVNGVNVLNKNFKTMQDAINARKEAELKFPESLH